MRRVLFQARRTPVYTQLGSRVRSPVHAVPRLVYQPHSHLYNQRVHSKSYLTIPSLSHERVHSNKGALAYAAALVAVLTWLASNFKSVQAEEEREDSSNSSSPSSSATSTPKDDGQEGSVADDNVPEPPFFDFVLVGGGAAAFAAYIELREHRPDARILFVAEEDALPYARPPLSQSLWRLDSEADVAATLNFKTQDGSIVTPTFQKLEFWEHDRGTELATGTRALALDVPQHLLLLSDGEIVKYGKLLLATGSSPRVPTELVATVAHNSELLGHITTYHNYRDFQSLDAIIRDPRISRIAVIGGGLLGTELAYGLATRSSTLAHSPRVTLLVDDAFGPFRRVFPVFLRKELTRYLSQRGVEVRLNARAKSISEGSEKEHPLVVALENGSTESVDHVVLAVGSIPRVEIATESSLEVAPDGGFLANSDLQVARDVWAAGDAASFWNTSSKRRERISHSEHASMSGRLAARNMLGVGDENEEELMHLQANWQRHFTGNIGDFHYEALGELNPDVDTVSVWERSEGEAGNDTDLSSAELDIAINPPLTARRGVLYYLREKRVVGVLLWNLRHVDAALLALKLPREYDGETLEALRRVIPFEESELSNSKPETEQTSDQ